MNFNFIEGTENSLADTLSREIAAATITSSIIISKHLKNQIREGYKTDKFCLDLRKCMPKREDCKEQKGLMFIENRLIIPDKSNIRQELIKTTHQNLGHLGSLKTLKRLWEEFYWQKMTSDVGDLIKECNTCQRVKSNTSATPGKMRKPEMPSIPLKNLALDFIGPLPRVNKYDYLLTCTFRLSGFVQLIPCNKKDTVEKTAQRFLSHWIAILGTPLAIIRERETMWTSKFWKSLMDRIGTKMHLKTAYHPQKDGGSERTNKAVGQVLRTFTLKRKSRWLEALPMTEFAINSAMNISTGFSPFEPVLGEKPRLFQPILDNADEQNTFKKWFKKRRANWIEAKDTLWESRVKQAIQHNKRRVKKETFPKGEWVLINNHDWRSGTSTKLKEKWEGPYLITSTSNGGINVTLALTKEDKRHPTFHVSKIKPFRSEWESMKQGMKEMERSKSFP